MVGNGMGAKHGILFKNAVSLENAGRTQIVVLDKTGTITQGQPKVTDLLPAPRGHGEGRTAPPGLCPGAEKRAPPGPGHPGAGPGSRPPSGAVTGFQALPGNGLTATWQGAALRGWQRQLHPPPGCLPPEMEAPGRGTGGGRQDTSLFQPGIGRLMGIIAVADVMKEDSPQAIRELQAMGIQVVMLTRGQSPHRPGHRPPGRGGPGDRRGPSRREGAGDPPAQGAGEGRHGRGRHQRRPRPHPGGPGHRHRGGHRRGHRRGRLWCS